MTSSLARGRARSGQFSMLQTSCLRRPHLSIQSVVVHRLIPRPWASSSSTPTPSANLSPLSHYQTRKIHRTTVLRDVTPIGKSEVTPHRPVLANLEQFKQCFDIPPASPKHLYQVGQVVTVHGFVSKRRDISTKNAFVDLLVTDGPSLQFMSSWQEKDSPEHKTHMALKAVTAWSPVALTGTIKKRRQPQLEFNETQATAREHEVFKHTKFELTLHNVHSLNAFPSDIIISKGAMYPPHLRHLEMRFDQTLQDRLAIREFITRRAEQYLHTAQFHKIETPLLFKSTPEGAREFLVPTRRKGYAYALPQSPQQYKQMLMAAGVRRYFQFARCFRDEDLRADRQPEFTQLDLEMAFATGEDVMAIVEGVVKDLLSAFGSEWRLLEANGPTAPAPRARPVPAGESEVEHWPINNEWLTKMFQRITYEKAMSLYGSDKPDLRIPNTIQRIDHLLSPSFVSMITDLQDPIVEACVFRFQPPSSPSTADKAEDNSSPKPPMTTTQSITNFVKSLWDNLPKPLYDNPEGQPVPLIIDTSKPLMGLSSLGHEAASNLLSDVNPNLSLEPDDVLVLQARPNAPHSGGSTPLGVLRNHIYQQAVENGFLPYDPSFHFLWVTDFPLFTRNDGATSDPGQGGSAGFASTHHPFTAPLTSADFDLLATDPLRVKADHYDLVVNGVEVGGGSRRIHVASVQDYVLREVLQMTDEGLSHFKHLLEALRAGCPPHAGFAFGWDRLVAVLSYTNSVRDVIAFPKNKKGEEPVGKAPGKVEDKDWEVYHLQQARKAS